jgi:hypothetical protein
MPRPSDANFLLSGTGLTASAFYALSQQTSGGQPPAPYYAVATLTNADGLGSGGIAVVGALTATVVPLPAGWPLLLSGVGMLTGVIRRRDAVEERDTNLTTLDHESLGRALCQLPRAAVWT